MPVSMSMSVAESVNESVSMSVSLSVSMSVSMSVTSSVSMSVWVTGIHVRVRALVRKKKEKKVDLAMSLTPLSIFLAVSTSSLCLTWWYQQHLQVLVDMKLRIWPHLRKYFRVWISAQGEIYYLKNPRVRKYRETAHLNLCCELDTENVRDKEKSGFFFFLYWIFARLSKRTNRTFVTILVIEKTRCDHKKTIKTGRTGI